MPHQSASKRTMPPQTAPCCPEAPPKAEQNREKRSDALDFMFFVHTGLTRDVETRETLINKLARVTSCIFCFWLTQDSGRLPFTWNPQETLIKKLARVTPCLLCFWFTWDSGRLPVTWNPRETLDKKLPIVTPSIELFLSVCVCVQKPIT